MLKYPQALDLADVLQGVEREIDTDCHLSVICYA
jgi:hypothetical protein